MPEHVAFATRNIPLKDSPTLTRRQALHRHQSLWATLPGGSIKTYGSARRSHYDVIIVGAGISGALMANALIGKRLRILLVDRRQPVHGSSLASTAMIQHEIDTPLHALAKLVGTRKAQRIWQRSAGAVEQLGRLVSDLNLKCAFRAKKSLFLAGDEYGARALRMEVDARVQAGLGAEFLDAHTLHRRFSIERSAAIESAVSASANPAQLTAAILRTAKKEGVEIASPVEIKDLMPLDDAVILSTSQGWLLSARAVVFCTGYEFLDSLASKRQQIVSTWALASRPRLKKPGWLNDYLVWEGAEPYLYFRSTSDGRVILGGEDENAEAAYKDEDKRRQKTKILVDKLADLTGISIGRPDFEWSAAFGVTPDGLPMIGRVPDMENVFVAMGFGGNGITFSQIAATLISGEILGHRDPDWDLFPIS